MTNNEILKRIHEKVFKEGVSIREFQPGQMRAIVNATLLRVPDYLHDEAAAMSLFLKVCHHDEVIDVTVNHSASLNWHVTVTAWYKKHGDENFIGQAETFPQALCRAVIDWLDWKKNSC